MDPVLTKVPSVPARDVPCLPCELPQPLCQTPWPRSPGSIWLIFGDVSTLATGPDDRDPQWERKLVTMLPVEWGWGG